MSSLRTIAAAVALLLAATLVAACGDDGEVVAPTATADDAATEPADEPTAISFAPDGPASFPIIAGGVSESIDVEQFMPATVRIREGDSIDWSGQGYEGHTVTFYPSGVLDVGTDEYIVEAPDEPGTLEFNQSIALASAAQGSYDGTAYTNSGFFGVPAPGGYSLTFPTAGVYPYLCMVHPLVMRGTVVVEPGGAEVPSPEAVAAEGSRQLARFVEEANALGEATEADRRAANERGSGFDVSVGVDTPQAQVLSFMPADLEVEVGDTVVFWNSDRDFHNVIFAPTSADAPQFPILRPPDDDRAGFRLLINPESEREIPPPAGFGPTDVFGSGIMGITWPRMYWSVTFEQPGTYNYFCTIHTLAAMSGVIEVREPG